MLLLQAETVNSDAIGLQSTDLFVEKQERRCAAV